MQRSRWPAALVALAVAASQGCGSTPSSRFYVLEALAADAAPAQGSRSIAIDVGPVVLAQGLDRPQMLRRLGPNEVRLDDYSRWADPLDDNIGRVLADNLGVLTGSENIGQVPDAETQLDSWQVTVQVLRCEAGSDGHSLFMARWRLFPPDKDQPSVTRLTTVTAPLPTPDAAGMAAALSANLAEMAREIAAALPAS